MYTGGGYPSLSSTSSKESKKERRQGIFSKRIVLLGLLILFALIPAFASSSDFSARVNVAPYSLAVFDFYNGKDIEGAEAVTATSYGFSASVEGDWRMNNMFRLYPEAGYSLALKKDTVIPEGKAVQYIKFGAGADCIFSLSEKAELYTGLFAGGMFHINSKKANFAPYFGVRLGFDWALTEKITLGASSRFALSFLKTDSRLTDSLTLMIDPVSLAVSYVF